MRKKTPISRRRFLGGVGMAALATGAPSIFSHDAHRDAVSDGTHTQERSVPE
jgi:hypothetical protein